MGFYGDILVYDRNGDQIDTLEGKNGSPYTCPYDADEHYWVGMAGSCGGLCMNLPKGENTIDNLTYVKLINELTYVWNIDTETTAETDAMVDTMKSTVLGKILNSWIICKE